MDEAHLGADTPGVWTATQARAAGLSRWQVQRRLADGRWQALHRGVYADGGVVPDARMRAWGAVLAAGGAGAAIAAGRTAARLWGLPLVDDHDSLLPASARQAHLDDVAVRRGLHATDALKPARLRLRPGDRVLLSGVPTLSPCRTLVDLARLVPPRPWSAPSTRRCSSASCPSLSSRA